MFNTIAGKAFSRLSNVALIPRTRLLTTPLHSSFIYRPSLSSTQVRYYCKGHEHTPPPTIVVEARKYVEFVCGVCSTTVQKTCSTHSYEKGVVLMQCPGCDNVLFDGNIDLIADHLGWTGFEEGKTIEEIAAEKGIIVKRTKS